MPGTLASHRTAPVHQHSTCSERRHLPASRVREKMPVRRHPKAGHGRLRIHASFRPQPRKQSEFAGTSADRSRSIRVAFPIEIGGMRSLSPRSPCRRDREKFGRERGAGWQSLQCMLVGLLGASGALGPQAGLFISGFGAKQSCSAQYQPVQIGRYLLCKLDGAGFRISAPALLLPNAASRLGSRQGRAHRQCA